MARLHKRRNYSDSPSLFENSPSFLQMPVVLPIQRCRQKRLSALASQFGICTICRRETATKGASALARSFEQYAPHAVDLLYTFSLTVSRDCVRVHSGRLPVFTGKPERTNPSRRRLRNCHFRITFIFTAFAAKPREIGCQQPVILTAHCAVTCGTKMRFAVTCFHLNLLLLWSGC